MGVMISNPAVPCACEWMGDRAQLQDPALCAEKFGLWFNQARAILLLTAPLSLMGLGF